MSESGDRHLRRDPGGLLPPLRESRHHVSVAADRGYAATLGGQSLLRMLVDLLARQFGVLEQVALVIPAVPADPRAFSGPVDADLPSTLLALGAAVGGPEVAVVLAHEAADHFIFVGAGEPSNRGPSPTIYAIATSWSATVSTEPLLAPIPSGELPFGPYLAAALATDRLFRLLHGITIDGTSHIELLAEAERKAAPNDLAELHLPPAYLIGLGAVGVAALAALAAARISGTVVGMDPDGADATNRNRLLSMHYDDVGRPKSELAAGLVRSSAIKLYPNGLAWPDYYSDPDRIRPESLAANEAAYRFEWVLSAVDRNVHRRNIANVLPRHVLSGSTNGLVAQSAYMSMDGPCECLGCNHPIPTFDIDAARAELEGLASDERADRLRAKGASEEEIAAIEDYVRDPGCANVGAAALRRLGVGGGVDWSVGFVSAAAGVLLAVDFVRAVVFGPASDRKTAAERRLIFWGIPELTQSLSRRKDSCPVCGDPGRQAAFAQRWRDA